jgi:thiol:disulfide interchange protein DsbA
MLVASLALLPLVARAQEGVSYTTLRRPLPVDAQDKIEVAEFFTYGCRFCYSLEGLLEAWVPKLKPDTVFRHIPAVFEDPRFVLDAALFYTFEALGVLGKLHRPLFDAIHLNRLRTSNKEALFAWLAQQGVDTQKFEATMNSFGVQSKLKRAGQLTLGSGIDGTPALLVHGRYTISAEQGPTQEGMLATADRLVATLRRSLRAPAKK